MNRASESRYVRSRGSVASCMAGYSGTPLPQKLGIKPLYRIALLDAPKGFEIVEHMARYYPRGQNAVVMKKKLA